MSCAIDFTGGNFTFNYPEKYKGVSIRKISRSYSTATIYEGFLTTITDLLRQVPSTNPILNLRTKTFAQANAMINRGDSIKDKTPDIVLTQLEVFSDGIIGGKMFNGNDVKAISKLIADDYEKKGIIIKQLFSRQEKGDKTTKDKWGGLQFRCTFDSGLGLQNFLPDGFKKVESFGKYIDPSSSRDSDSFFPDKGILLTISQSAFQELGYANCSLTNAKAIDKDTYTYSMILGGLQLNTTTADDQYKETIFVGNAKKKGIADTLQKRAAVLGKSLGDKLMTFLTYVEYMLNKELGGTDVICISTCDEIVLLFCMILGLPCLFSNIDTGTKLRLNKVLYYNPDNVSVDKAATRFAKEKAIVLKGYADLIAIVIDIRDREKRVISMTGDNKKFKISREFYDRMIIDLNNFTASIDGVVVEPTDSIATINMKVAYVQRYKVNSIFKKNKPKPDSDIKYSLIATTSKYSVAASAYDKMKIFTQAPSIQLPAKTVSLSFSFIAKTFFKEEELTFGAFGGSKIMKGGVPPLEVPLEVEFDDEPIIFYYKDKEEEKIFEGNAYLQLKSDIDDIYTQYAGIFPYDDIYSETLTALCSDYIVDGNVIAKAADYSKENLTLVIKQLFTEKLISLKEQGAIDEARLQEIQVYVNAQAEQLFEIERTDKRELFQIEQKQEEEDELVALALIEDIENRDRQQRQKNKGKFSREIDTPTIFSMPFNIPNQSIPNQSIPNQSMSNQSMSNQSISTQPIPNPWMSTQPIPDQLMVTSSKKRKDREDREDREPENVFKFNHNGKNQMMVTSYGGKKNKKTLTKQTKKYNKQTKKKRNYPKNVRKNSKTIKQKNNKTQKNKTKK